MERKLKSFCMELRGAGRKAGSGQAEMTFLCTSVLCVNTLAHRGLRGFAKLKKFQKNEITMEVAGRVHVSLGIFFLKSQNAPIYTSSTVLIFGVLYVCIFCANASLKVASHYDLSVPKKR